MDKELSAMLRAEYAKRGIKFMLDTKKYGSVIGIIGTAMQKPPGKTWGLLAREKS